MRTEEKLIHFAHRIEIEQAERYRRDSPGIPEDQYPRVYIRPGKKYVKIDVDTSGKYMVTEAGEIFGIKGYGVIHRGQQYGTLDTIDAWEWGGYVGRSLKDPVG